MDKAYQRFLRLGLSLSPMGIETREDNTPYFCTPKGAVILGWAGVDGVHYCTVRGLGSMIFAVSPMNAAREHVHPVAEDFQTLLRLLLACGSEAALEQAWQWDEEQFNAFLAEHPPTEEQRAALALMGEKMALLPMEDPWRYLHGLRERFDGRSIRYTEDFCDPDMNATAQPAAPAWKVYFDGSFWGHHGRGHAGKPIPLGKAFDWAGHRWLIPAAYACGKGLVVDFCMRVEAEEIRSFMEKWGLREADDSCEHLTREQQERMDRDNPLCLEFCPELEVNGQKLRAGHGCSMCFNPCVPEGEANELEGKWAADHYALDAACGWVISRYAFPWKTKRRVAIRTLALRMEQQPEPVPGPHFTAHAPGEAFRFRHPVSQTEHTLTVRDIEQQTIPEHRFGSDRWWYPTHFTVMSYALSPETEGRMTVSDCAEGDRPVEKVSSGEAFSPDGSSDFACIGIIGGADVPTVVLAGGSGRQDQLCAACSALHFEPVQGDIEWRMTFYEKRFEGLTIPLIES